MPESHSKNKSIVPDYIIFVDESGSLNEKNKGFFSVTFFVVKKVNLEQIMYFFGNQIASFRKKYNIPKKKEIKGHFLKKEFALPSVGNAFLKEIFVQCLKKGKIITGFVDNKDRKNFSETNNDIFYKMMGLLIDEMLEKKWLLKGETIDFFLDQRPKLKFSPSEFVSNHHYNNRLKISKFCFLDSQKSIMIQIVDHLSCYLCGEILKSLKSKKKLIFREIPNYSNLNIIKLNF